MKEEKKIICKKCEGTGLEPDQNRGYFCDNCDGAGWKYKIDDKEISPSRLRGDRGGGGIIIDL